MRCICVERNLILSQGENASNWCGCMGYSYNMKHISHTKDYYDSRYIWHSNQVKMVIFQLPHAMIRILRIWLIGSNWFIIYSLKMKITRSVRHSTYAHIRRNVYAEWCARVYNHGAFNWSEWVSGEISGPDSINTMLRGEKRWQMKWFNNVTCLRSQEPLIASATNDDDDDMQFISLSLQLH